MPAFHDIIDIERAEFKLVHFVIEYTVHVTVSPAIEAWVYGYVEIGNKHLRVERTSATRPAELAVVIGIIAAHEDWLIEKLVEISDAALEAEHEHAD